MEEKTINLLHKIRIYSEESFDKQIVYLAGGGLVLTVGFVKEVVSDLTNSSLLWMLYSSWVLFAMTLVINLVSHKFSTKSVDYFLESKFDKGTKWNRIATLCNTLSVVLLFCAIISFIIFTLNNFIK